MKKFNGKELFRRFQKLALVSHDNRWKRNLYNTGILNTIVVLNSCRLVSKKKSYKYGPITDSSCQGKTAPEERRKNAATLRIP